MNVRRPSKTTGGLTLIEALVYVFLVALLVVTTINMLMVLTRAYANFRLGRTVNQSAKVTLERMVHEIRSAGSVDLVQSQLGTSPGRLVLKDAAGAETAEFLWQDGTILLEENGNGVFASTTAPQVVADNVIYRLLSTPVSQALRVELTLSAARGDLIKTADVYASAILRNSY